MARKTGQIVRRVPTTWLVRIYVGRDSETRRRRYVGKFIHGGLRSAQAHLDRMLAERNLGRNIRSSWQTLDMYLDHWLNICACPRLQVKSFRDYSNLLGSCRGGDGQPEVERTCDTAKGMLLLSRNPADPMHNIQTLVHYDAKGRITSSNPAFDDEINRVLNLNSAGLINSRIGELRASQNALRIRGTSSRAARERAQNPAQELNPHQRVREAMTFSRDRNCVREAVVDERVITRDALRRGMGKLPMRRCEAILIPGLLQENSRRWNGLRCQADSSPPRRPSRQNRRSCAGCAKVKMCWQPTMSRADAIQVADRHPHLNRAQKSVLDNVLSSPDRVQSIQGFAGAGKTTTLSAVRGTVEIQGYEVQGFAPTSRAARQLRAAGIEAGTLQSFLARAVPSDAAPERKHFYFVDESSLASTNQMREFLTRLGPIDRVLLIGDVRQHQEAGRPFEQLQEAGMRTAKLDEIVRQKDPALKSVVEFLTRGRTSAAVDMLQQQGRIRENPVPQERIRTIARSFAESPVNTNDCLSRQRFAPRIEYGRAP